MSARLKKAAKVLGVVLATLVAVLLVNTLRMRPVAYAASAPSSVDAVDVNVVAQHLAGAIRFKTVSHEDLEQDDGAAMAALRGYLEATYPKVHAGLAREIVGEHALLYTWRGIDPSLPPVLFAAHMDVVPVEPGTEGAWTHPPFAGEIADGFVWGRGALDDKGALVATLEAAELLIGAGWQPKRTLLFAFGNDEEVGGQHGAKLIAEKLRAAGVHLAWALDEGGGVTEGIVPDVARPVAVLAVSEKGYVSVELVSTGKGGHSSMPPPATTIGVLSAAIARLEQSPMPPRLTEVSRRSFELLGPDMPFSRRLVVANLWLLEPALLGFMSRSTATAALVRTTTAPTIIEGGVKENVLPSRARAVVNFRILPGDSVEGVLAHVRSVVADPRIEVRALDRTLTEPAPISPMSGPAYELLATSIRAFHPDAIVVPNILVGASDGRWYGPLSDGVYHFVGTKLDKDDLPRMHGTNERVSVSGLDATVRWYAEVLRRASAP